MCKYTKEFSIDRNKKLKKNCLISKQNRKYTLKYDAIS